jgi:hypothetical protein
MAYEVINKPWTETIVSDNKFAYKEQSVSDVLTSGTNTAVTPGIDSSALLNENKVMVFIEIVTEAAGSGVTCDMFMEMSPDGTNWSDHVVTDYIEVIDDIDIYTSGYKVYMVDLTEFSVPYYRIGINSDGANIGTLLKFKMGYAYPKN